VSKNFNSNKGFTLIELLVVVAIIGVLSSIVLTVTSSSRAKARNAVRLSDMNTLLKAFKIASIESGSFPLSSGFDCVSVVCSEGFSASTADATVDAFFTPFLSQKPTDPSGGNRGFVGYRYVNPFNAISLYDGFVFTSGAYLEFVAEPPITSGSCGTGRIYSVSSNFIACFIKID